MLLSCSTSEATKKSRMVTKRKTFGDSHSLFDRSQWDLVVKGKKQGVLIQCSCNVRVSKFHEKDVKIRCEGIAGYQKEKVWNPLRFGGTKKDGSPPNPALRNTKEGVLNYPLLPLTAVGHPRRR